MTKVDNDYQQSEPGLRPHKQINYQVQTKIRGIQKSN